jgi:hypothetical protein
VLVVSFAGTGDDVGFGWGPPEPTGRPGPEKLSDWLADLEQMFPISRAEFLVSSHDGNEVAGDVSNFGPEDEFCRV